MGKINWERVLLGGLLAGFIINIFEYVTNGVVLAANWDAAMKALGRHLSMSAHHRRKMLLRFLRHKASSSSLVSSSVVAKQVKGEIDGSAPVASPTAQGLPAFYLPQVRPP
jgi:hypothetical protein